MSIRTVADVTLDTVGGFSDLFIRYAAGGRSGLPPYVAPWGDRADDWQERWKASVALPEGSGVAWGAVLDDVAVLSRRLGTSAETLRKLDAARVGEAAFVVTGQQPGVLGGPLHTAYKIATTIALAVRLEARTGHPVVPLYWCGADDTDFAEVRDLNILGDRYAPITTSIPAGAYQPGAPVGDIDVTALRAIWNHLRRFVLRERGQEIVAVVDRAFELGEDHAEVTCAVLVGIFDGQLAVVDGRMPAVRRFAGRVLREYLEREDDWKTLVRKAGASLETAGFHAQLTPGDDSGVFLLEGGLRKAVSPEQDARLLAAVREDPASCAPGVVVRNLVQDYTFRPLAVVLGPAEVAYRAQMGGLYDALTVSRPVVIPRLSATWLPAELTALAAQPGDLEGLMEDPQGFRTTLYGRCLPESLEGAAARLHRDVSRALTVFGGELGDAIPAKALSRVRQRLRDVEGRLDGLLDAVYEVGKATAVERWPFLPHLEELVRPQDRLQERRLAAIVPAAFGADAAGTGWVEMAAAHLEGYVDGRTTHVVYSNAP